MGTGARREAATTPQRGMPAAPFARYAEVRASLRTGDLLLCAGRSGLSRLIQRATRSPWSHVAMILRVESIDRVLVVESVESFGVRAVPLTHYVGDKGSGRPGYDGELLIARHREVARLDDAHLCQVLRGAVDLLGREYDSREIVRIATRIVTNSRRSSSAATDKTPLERDDAYICSEFVWECLHAAGIDIAHDPRGFIAPCDFLADPNVEPLVRLCVRSGEGELHPCSQGDS